MSTRNDKCPGCGALEVVFGTPLYTCGTTLGMGRVNRTMDCLATEGKALLAGLNRQIEELRARIARLNEAGDACAETAPTPQQIAWKKAKEAKP